jgi:isopentenyl-diphosphate Delta-isomerase
MTEDRKNDHLELALSSQADNLSADPRFHYEPMLGSFSKGVIVPFPFLGKTMRNPLWISSMTGGATHARKINLNLAKACREFGLGMGLGSCRILLEDKKYFPDFNMRDEIGDDLPFYANIGIAQLERMIRDKEEERIPELVSDLRADGVIIHVNPIQEWLQEEGDVLEVPPLETIEKFLSLTKLKVIVKEVGQGMGQESIRRLLEIPIEALELAAFGGTNFATLELKRKTSAMKELYEPLSRIGHPAGEMIGIINRHAMTNDRSGCRQIIISGGIHSFLDGYYNMSVCRLPSIYGQASGFLRHALGNYEELQTYIAGQINGLVFARAYLKVKEQS